MTHGYQMYQELSISNEVLEATPVKLICLLLDKALQQVEVIQQSIEGKNIHAKFTAIRRVNDIVAYLRDCLNMQDANTTAVAQSFDAVYILIEKKLFRVSIQNNVAELSEIREMFSQLRSAWANL